MARRSGYFRQDWPANGLTYDVKEIPYRAARDFVTRHHYAHGMSNSAQGCYGLFDRGWLIGAIAFCVPVQERVRQNIFGAEHASRVTELSRLVILDVTPPNAESYFISRALRMLHADRPDFWGVVAYADPTAGHVGTIYQATCSRYWGLSRPVTTYMEPSGRLRHQKQCKHHVTLAEAETRGWSPVHRCGKHRYLFYLPADRRHRRELEERSLVEALPYPTEGSTKNGIAPRGAFFK